MQTAARELAAPPTIWGLDPVQLHDHFWAARGVHVVRQGELAPIVEDAELFLLTDPRTLAIFRLRWLVEAISWTKPDVLLVRLNAHQARGYRESIIAGEDGTFRQFARNYGGSDSRLARVALTRERDLAVFWREAADSRAAWRMLRQRVPRDYRDVMTVNGRAYDRSSDAETAQFARDLVQSWQNPAATISGIRQQDGEVWVYDGAPIKRGTRFIGPAWVGAGRSGVEAPTVLGPAVLWDDPKARPRNQVVRWEDIEPTEALNRPRAPRKLSSLHQAAKRTFDMVFALTAILLTLPVYPLVMLAIWLEDGRPFFFAHRRETVGGREFPCLKFRSMRKDADQIKTQLGNKNQADGPQFFIENDPRLTRVGRIIRKLNIDELPQFFNVLAGHMSIVGPRPSPRKENQYCPAWREARLSVRPGVTGLWQVQRTRRRGMDFQEWIKYDIEYVDRASWWLDLTIIFKTVAVIIHGILRT